MSYTKVEFSYWRHSRTQPLRFDEPSYYELTHLPSFAVRGENQEENKRKKKSHKRTEISIIADNVGTFLVGQIWWRRGTLTLFGTRSIWNSSRPYADLRNCWISRQTVLCKRTPAWPNVSKGSETNKMKKTSTAWVAHGQLEALFIFCRIQFQNRYNNKCKLRNYLFFVEFNFKIDISVTWGIIYFLSNSISKSI